MHEASIVQSLIALAAQKTPPGSRVLEVQVALGLLTSISPDAMLFYFEALRDDSLGPARRAKASRSSRVGSWGERPPRGRKGRKAA